MQKVQKRPSFGLADRRKKGAEDAHLSILFEQNREYRSRLLVEDEFADWDFLRSMRKIEDFPLNAREDKKYMNFRRQKKLSVTDKADTTRVFVRHEELYPFVTALRRYCKKEDTGIVWNQNNQIEESFEFDGGDILTVKCVNQENEDSILEISSETMKKKASMICSHCHNILPSGFFHYDQITIGLIGKKDAGKTCMLVSLLANQRRAINGSSDVLSFEEVQTIQDIQVIKNCGKR